MLCSGARRSAELRSPSPLPRLHVAPARPPLRVRSPFAPLRVSARGSRFAASAPHPASLRSRRLPLRSRRRALRSVSSACPCVSRGPRPCVRAASPPSRYARWLRGSAPAVGCPLAPRRPCETVQPYKIRGQANPRPREREGNRREEQASEGEKMSRHEKEITARAPPLPPAFSACPLPLPEGALITSSATIPHIYCLSVPIRGRLFAFARPTVYTKPSCAMAWCSRTPSQRLSGYAVPGSCLKCNS